MASCANHSVNFKIGKSRNFYSTNIYILIIIFQFSIYNFIKNFNIKNNIYIYLIYSWKWTRYDNKLLTFF